MTIAWLQITAATAKPALAEAVFERWDAEAVSVLDAGSEMAVENTPGEQPDFERARVVGLFTDGTLADPIIRDLEANLGENTTITTERLENQDWASAWLAQHPPLCFGNRLWIAPHSAPIETGDRAIVVRLDPGLAFGTGTHATTALCLDWLAAAKLEDRRVLDYGCGSGILAIAAAKLGAAHVTAVDIDSQALRATRENAARNAVDDRIDTPAIDAIAGQRFDVVLANILARPLVELAPTLTAHAEDGAPLILSGLLSRHVDEIQRAYSPVFVFAPATLRDDWARLDGRCRRP